MIKKLSPELQSVKRKILNKDCLDSAQSHIACIGITLDRRLVGYRFICIGSISSKLNIMYLDINLSVTSGLGATLQPDAFITGKLGDNGIISSESELSGIIKAVDVSDDYDLCKYLIKRIGGI